MWAFNNETADFFVTVDISIKKFWRMLILVSPIKLDISTNEIKDQPEFLYEGYLRS